jgi:hypothetical protein
MEKLMKKTWIGLTTYFLAGSICFAGHHVTYAPAQPDLVHDGMFVGLNANLNSLNLTQNSYGLGISNIRTNTGANSNGIADGNGAPFNNTANTLAPGLQFGFIKHYKDTPNLYGIKFTYQYLGSTATNPNLYIPQIGHTTSAVTGLTSPLYGYVNGDSIQVTTNHQLSLLAFVGRSFGNGSFYIGAGPGLVNMKSKNYYSIGYAVVDGATVNVTGLVGYSTPSIWAWAGTAQIGANYFFSPSWFVDLAYTYTVTGTHTVNHEQGFANSSEIGGISYTTSGTIVTKTSLSERNQTVTFSINKLFDF